MSNAITNRKFLPQQSYLSAKQEESFELCFPFLCVSVPSIRRDLQEVKEELRDERTKRQALQVSRASVKDIQPIHCTSLMPLIVFPLLSVTHPGGSAQFEAETLSRALAVWRSPVYLNFRRRCLWAK